MSPRQDVIVVGLGGMGIAAAHRLSARGARVLGLEKFGPVHNRVPSHGGSRITRRPFREPMVHWEPYRDGVRVHAAENTCTAGQLAICPGAWAPQLLTGLAVPIAIEPQVLFWFQPVKSVRPFLPGVTPSTSGRTRKGWSDRRRSRPDGHHRSPHRSPRPHRLVAPG